MENIKVIEKERNEEVIMPFEKKEEFFVEDLGIIEKKPFFSFVKRMTDILVSFFGLLILGVPMLIIAAAVWCTSKGPAFFVQDRLGLNGKRIKIIKFRTMCVDAEKNGAQWSRGDKDVRITPLGRFLRKSRIDELPQLWCILKGDMSLVGPRPEREVFYNEFEKYIHGFSERLKVKPGLTGWAQINGGYNLRPEEKVVYDVEYIKKRSLIFDLKIIFLTFGVVFTHHGAK
ncbi:MAG: sugar transferase [Clostridia bacterium]|nr:sugar transferase [Clostridia bacterium]